MIACGAYKTNVVTRQLRHGGDASLARAQLDWGLVSAHNKGCKLELQCSNFVDRCRAKSGVLVWLILGGLSDGDGDNGQPNTIGLDLGLKLNTDLGAAQLRRGMSMA